MSRYTLYVNVNPVFSGPLVNNDAVKLSAELLYLFILGNDSAVRFLVSILASLAECAYRSSAQAKVCNNIDKLIKRSMLYCLLSVW